MIGGKLIGGAGGDAGGGFSSGIPVVSEVFGFLTEIFSQAFQISELARATDQVEQQAWSNTINLAGWAYGAFGDVLGTLGGLLKSLGGLLWHIVHDLIYLHIMAIVQAILKFLQHLKNLIAPLIKYLEQLQKAYNAAVGQYLRKMLDVVQRIRKILVPFRLLHLSFATKLDATLARYESDLGAKWAKLIAFNTQILGVLNDVLTPQALMRPGHALGSIGMMIGAVREAVGAADLRALFCMGAATTPAPLVNPWSTTAALTVSNIRLHQGDYAVYEAQRDQTLRQYALDLGTVSPV